MRQKNTVQTSAFQPAFEYEDAKKLAAQLGIEMVTIYHDVLKNPQVVANPANRCYYCKSTLFSLLKERAREDGYFVIIDGTNASDDVSDRPGMKALEELSVKSPLREAGLTKTQIRQLSKEAGLFTWISQPMPALRQGYRPIRQSHGKC